MIPQSACWREMQKSHMWKNLWRSENGFYFINKLCFSFIVDFFHLCWIREIFHILVFLTLIVKCRHTTARCSPGWGGLLWPPKRNETLGLTASYMWKSWSFIFSILAVLIGVILRSLINTDPDHLLLSVPNVLTSLIQVVSFHPFKNLLYFFGDVLLHC